MSQNIIRDALIFTGLSIASCVIFINRYEIYPYLGLEISPPVSESGERITLLQSLKERKAAQNSQVPQTTVVTTPTAASGSVVTLFKNPRDGQFWTDASVNSGRVHFLVDTGASSVSLTLQDAKKVGIRERDLVYNIPISTAGGQNMAARVTLDRVSVGAVSLRNVEALVVPTGLSVSLLGMTYLGQLQKVEASRDQLILRL